MVFGQDKPENTLKAFLPADVDKQLQKASSKPLSLEVITDFYGKLCCLPCLDFHTLIGGVRLVIRTHSPQNCKNVNPPLKKTA